MFQNTIANAYPDGVLLVDRAGRITWLNPAARDMFGWPGDTLVGQSVNVLIPEDKRRRHAALMRNMQDFSGQADSMADWRRVEARRRDGQRFPVNVWLSGTHSTQGPRTIAFVRDMSELNSREHELAEAHARLEEKGRQNALLALVAEHAKECVIITDAQGRTIWVNNALERLSGYAAEEFSGRKPGELLQGPDTDPATVNRIGQAVREGREIQCELLNYRKSGESYWLDMNITPICDQSGRPEKFIAVEREITEAKQHRETLAAAREAAKRAENRLASAIEAIPDGFVIYDAEDRLVMCNQALHEQFSFLSEQMVPGTKFEDLIRSAATNGQFDTEGLDPEAWVQKQLEIRRQNAQAETTVRFKDGRWMLRRERRTPQGEMIGVRSDITAFKEQEERLRAAKRKAERAESRLASAIEAISEGFAAYDEYDRLVMANEAFRNLHEGVADLIVPGATFSEIVLAAAERGYFDTQGEDPEDWVRKQVEKRLAEPHAETMVRFTDGRWMLRRERRTPEGEMIGIRSDVTAFKQQEAALEDARERAEAADRAKSEFVANISHELRTPINGIMGFTQLMLAGELSDKQRERAAIVKSSSGHLLQLVNDLLDLSRIASNRIELSPERFDLCELVNETIGLLKPLATERGLALAASSDLSDGAVIHADRSRIKQILLNLVGNGIKYTAQGGVTLTARPAGEGICFEIADTGPGMPADRLETIFDRFQRIDGSLTPSGGAGLGLAITKGLVELMGGQIEVQSELGAGSVFTVNLPLPVHNPPKGTPSASGGAAKPDQERSQTVYDILVAEDHPMNQLLISEVLNGINCRVTVAENGRQAVDQVEGNNFDLIIMDNQMPEMSGLEAIKHIRARADWKGRIPIVALTANAMRGAEKAYEAYGVEAFITKPFDMSHVIATVEQLGSAGRRLREEACAEAE